MWGAARCVARAGSVVTMIPSWRSLDLNLVSDASVQQGHEEHLPYHCPLPSADLIHFL